VTQVPDLPITICRVEHPDGEKYYLTCLPPEKLGVRGLAPEAIIGVLLRPLEPDEAITPAAFAQNRVFVDFLHRVIARHGPELPGLVAEAGRQKDGWLYVIDQRSRTPHEDVPAEDIIGAFEVRGRQVVPGSYRPFFGHRILTEAGFFRLGAELQAFLLQELANLA
jgi:hypothetical protein